MRRDFLLNRLIIELRALSSKQLGMITSLFNEDDFNTKNKIRLYVGDGSGKDDHTLNVSQKEWQELWDIMHALTDTKWKLEQEKGE